MQKIVLIATLTLKNSNNEGVLDALTTLHKATHQNDAGCLQYDVHQDADNKNTYVFIETWESEALLAEHMKKEHYNSYKAFMGDKVESMSLQKLKKIL